MTDRMRYVAHSAHLQFVGLVLGAIGWILTMTAAGLNNWRLWYLEDTSVVSSGQAWVGVWRVCFYSHALARFETCRAIGIADAFAPPEIVASQVLVMVASACGLAANITAGVAMRSVYFSVDEEKRDGRLFRAAGLLYVLTAACLLVALSWNLSSVLAGATIPFPPEFLLPAAPESQKVGEAIGVGYFASGLLLIGGVVFLCYRFPKQSPSSSSNAGGPEAAAAEPNNDPLHGPKDPLHGPKDPLHGSWAMTTLSPQTAATTPKDGDRQGEDNPAFHAEEEE